MKIGIIQTRGLGDIVIAAPIAMYYIERGCEVYWPIDSDFIEAFSYAFPQINFISVDKTITGNSTAEYFLNYPLQTITEIGCDIRLCLYSSLSGFDFGNEKIKNSLSFDAYKYAVSKVPFKEKWNFKPKRNIKRESILFDQLGLNPSDNYILVHDEGSNERINIDHLLANETDRIIKIKPITNNIFDWIGVIEHAKYLHFFDSVYANIVEQINFETPKTLYLRSKTPFSPVFKNAWNFS